MPTTAGNALTWGPDEEDPYLAGLTCGNCFAQQIGNYVKAKPKKGMKAHEIAEASRQASIDSVSTEFAKHECSPERLAKIAQEAANG